MNRKENCTFAFISINTEHWLRSVFLCGTQLGLFQHTKNGVSWWLRSKTIKRKLNKSEGLSMGLNENMEICVAFILHKTHLNNHNSEKSTGGALPKIVSHMKF